MKQCTNCNFKTERDDDRFCAVCGSRLKTVAANTFCESCGAAMRPYASFCTKCGSHANFFGPSLSASSEQCTDTSMSVMAGGSVPPKKKVPVPPAPIRSGGRPTCSISGSFLPEKYVFVPSETTSGAHPVAALPETGGLPQHPAVPGKKPLPLPSPEPSWEEGPAFVEMLDRRRNRIITKDEIRAMGELALEVIPERVAYYAPLVGVKYKEIMIRNYLSKWGSCNTAGELKFNCILMLAPPMSIDGVVVHELCHLLQMNHSKLFYAEVLRVFPEYWKWNKWLDEHCFILNRMEEGYVFRAYARLRLQSA